MPAYIALWKFTDQGAKNIKETVQRSRQTREENEKRGFKVIGLWWTQGEYDLVSIVEAPSEEAMMAGLLNIAAAGNVRSQTLRAFSEAEMESIVKQM